MPDSGVWTLMSPNGAPSQSPTLSCDCGTTLGSRANTTTTPTGLCYFRARVDHYCSFGFPHSRSNGTMGHYPVGVDDSFVASTQGRRCAPTLGSVSERRWRSLEFGHLPLNAPGDPKGETLRTPSALVNSRRSVHRIPWGACATTRRPGP